MAFAISVSLMVLPLNNHWNIFEDQKAFSTPVRCCYLLFQYLFISKCVFVVELLAAG